ncbi:MAG: imidazole glycerol phosphate synthase subunit HisH [Hyphomonadaceae bacterium]|nr:imidazole glycerol phosphate synthase subunit HisH [Hyphomonadaceae bacterium]
MTSVALIDYGAGNLRSAERALAHVGADVTVTSDPKSIARADRIVLPGQGAFAQCMGALTAKPGLIDALSETVLANARPFLGICVGMQLLASRGLEHEITAGLGWIPGVCRQLQIGPRDRLPHMGWNEVAPHDHPVLAHLKPAARMYFAHSFIVAPENAAHIAATTEHGERFAAALARDNILGVQFHPEKSQGAGLALLERFLNWNP